jgi:crossover junction endodeoxyribonuclease RuvC
VKILGIDPGIRAAGWAVVGFDGRPALIAAGVLRPGPSLPFGERLRALHAGLLEIVGREAPDSAAVEKVFSGVNPQSLITLGEARGVLLLALTQGGLDPGELTPAEVKRAVTGSGNAEKEQVRRMVAALLPGSGARRLPLDAADAAAVALAWGFRHAVRGARLASGAASVRTQGAPCEVDTSATSWKRRPSG